jgi:light-regulated signal transduction histidine kinase (bacteriophytochrome)
LVYALSHDLRGPLRGIRNYVDFLKMDLADNLSETATEDFDRLNRAASELDRMMKDLLDYCRLGMTQTSPEAIDLDAMVRDIRASMASESDCEVLVNDRLPTIVAPRDLIRKTLQNLIQNGLRYNNSPTRRVEISATSAGGETPRLILTVRDNGIGIAPQYHDKIFDVFQRLHNIEERSGTGMGLAIARKAVETLGGTIRVESEPGAGSAFHVEIPPTPQRTAAAATE